MGIIHSFSVPDGKNFVKADLVSLKSCLNAGVIPDTSCFTSYVTDNTTTKLQLVNTFGNIDTFESLDDSILGKDYFKNKIFVLIAIIFILFLVFRQK